jgi:hypothetical protein
VNQAAAALMLSKKLQSTAVKNQAKPMDLEIKQSDTAQAQTLLSAIRFASNFQARLAISQIAV